MNQQLLAQCRAALATPLLNDKERAEFMALLPQKTDADGEAILASIHELTSATADLSASIKAFVASIPPSLDEMTPEDVQAFSDDQWKDASIRALVRLYITQLGATRRSLDAGALVRILNDVLVKHPQWASALPDVFLAIQECIALAQWVRCTDLTRTELRELFTRRMIPVLQSDLDALRLLDDRFIFSKGDRASLVGDLEAAVTAFRSNEETIGRNALDRGERGVVPPTIRNWLIDYEALYTSEKPRGVVEEGSYITKSRNVQKLSPPDHTLLEKTLRTFDALLFPERHLEVVSQPAPSAVPSKPLPPKRMPAAPTIVTAGIDSGRDKKVEEMQKQLRAKNEDLLAQFFDLIISPQGVAAGASALVAGLTVLAEDNMVEKAVMTPKIREAFEAYLKTKNAPDILAGFKLAPTMPRFMRLFFEWVLQERGGLSEHDAARIGVRIANILKKHGNEKYARIAYFDAVTNTFKWN